MQKDFALSRKLQALREKTVLGNSPRYGRSRFVAIFLGVDGGGTKTTCVVGNEDSLLATATTGGSNVVRLGEEQARKSLHEAIHRACEAARIELSAVQRISVGMAGAGRPQIGDVVRRMVAEIFPGNVLIAGDMVIALEAAFGEGPGIVAISGTGSIAYGRNSTGRTARAGGWGFAISDEGSAHWIGRSAVVAVMKAHDEGSGSSLFKVISQAWDLTTLGDLVRAANATPAPNFAELFAPILAAAEAGDLSARTVLTQAGAELAGLAKTVISRIFEETPDVRVAMSGGVFRNSALVRQVFYNSLRSEYPSTAVASTVVEPVKGALEIARRGHVSG
jgi:glucosamine kinase